MIDVDTGDVVEMEEESVVTPMVRMFALALDQEIQQQQTNLTQQMKLQQTLPPFQQHHQYQQHHHPHHVQLRDMTMEEYWNSPTYSMKHKDLETYLMITEFLGEEILA